MIVQEPVQAAIWHCLNHYAYQDATFLAERLCSEVDSDESLFTLATCYYRSNQVHQAFWALQSRGSKSPHCRYLLARCAFELKKYGTVETALANENFIEEKHLDDIAKDFGEVACFALQLIARVCTQTERHDIAAEANKRALKLNPFLWHSFADLCNRGHIPDPNSIFQFTSNEIFATCQGHTNINSIVMGGSGGISETIELNHNNFSVYSSNFMTTPIYGSGGGGIEQQPITPNNNVSPALRPGGVGLIDETPTTLYNNCNTTSSTDTNVITATPYRKQFKYLSILSPTTPSFGVLPINNSPTTDSSIISLYSPQQQQQTQQQQPQQTLIEVNNDQKAIGKKIKGQVGSLIRKDTPLQLSKPIFCQTGNITPRTPNANTIGGQNVRRSSRLSFSNYSVKENSSKSPNINKFAAPRSPPRKSKQRVTKMNLTNTALNELNEKPSQKITSATSGGGGGGGVVEKEKIETITSAATDTKVLLNNNINNAQTMVQHMLQLKRQSAEGLMTLFRSLADGYLQLSQYNCTKAIDIFTNIPQHHYTSSWVQSQIAKAEYEQRNYDVAAKIFQEIHKKEPHRMHLMDIYSTVLWHLQRDVILSALAQDLMAQDKLSPITWCVTGNCFSLHKEHETAIKFFERAVQVDPDYAYSYTLLGHELVITEELEKAMSCFRNAILKDSRHYNAWFGIGTIYSKQERYNLAEIHYENALLINSKNSVIMVHIGAMQFYLKKTEQALQTLNRAIKLDPKNPLCKFHRGSMYFQMGKHQEALCELEELKQILPKESVVYYLIGKIHKKLGNVHLALMHFSWATDLDPKGANNQIKDAFDSNISQSGGVGVVGVGDGSVIGGNSVDVETPSGSSGISSWAVAGTSAAGTSSNVALSTTTTSTTATTAAATVAASSGEVLEPEFYSLLERSDDSTITLGLESIEANVRDYDSDSY